MTVTTCPLALGSAQCASLVNKAVIPKSGSWLWPRCLPPKAFHHAAYKSANEQPGSFTYGGRGGSPEEVVWGFEGWIEALSGSQPSERPQDMRHAPHCVLALPIARECGGEEWIGSGCSWRGKGPDHERPWIGCQGVSDWTIKGIFVLFGAEE